ncbi:substrate-binding periplasmic protein [Colwelliaceae bacterium 6441]
MIYLISSSVFAEKLNIVVGLAKPPYVLQETESGFEIEFVTQVLALMAKQPNFVYVPFGRSIRMLEKTDIDAIMTVNSNIIKDITLLTDIYITYHNVVITLKEDQLEINHINDLSQIPIAAFQTASKILGEEFSKVIKQNNDYYEIADQKRQVKLLFEKKVKALVIDVNIFKALSKMVNESADFSNFSVHEVFAESPYRIAFKNVNNIKGFNAALKTFKGTDKYLALKQKYNVIQ